MKHIEIFKASKHYSDLLDSFSVNDKLQVDLKSNVISKAIYFHICKMKYAGWRHRINFKRKKKHSISEFFQDIIAFYLKASLPNEYEIELETKRENTQIDIAIKKNGNYHFLIEIKTNIGYERPNYNLPNPYIIFEKRVQELATNFNFSPENIIYIFEDPGNVPKEFSEQFWDSKNKKPTPRSNKFPFSIIYPLFIDTDPYYWRNHPKGLKRANNFMLITDDEILQRAENCIVTPFEEILKKIMSANIS